MSYISDDDLDVNNNSNITTKFREAFETFTNGVNWNLTQASGDIVQLDGNAVSASYLVISKDPLQAGTETVLETIESFDVPIELAVGLHMSQRIAGHEVSMELVSTETPLTTKEDITISAISQSTTTLTVTTTLPHNLSAGQRIGIRSVSDSRFNYAQLVVASIPNAYSFTATAGPAGTITSLTATGPNNSGYVYHRSSMGYAKNGMSEIFEGTSVTSASAYIRSSSGDSLPSGTAGGSHIMTTSTTGSQVPISQANVFPFRSSSEYKFNLQADRATWYDVAVDSTAAPTTRLLRTEVIPDVTKKYKLRFRVTSYKSSVIPVAQIVSAVKSASTTATVTTDVAHGLTTGDWIQVFGVRDQTNFAYNAAAFQVASVINSTQFTASWGASATATTYGGYVARINGNNVAYGNVTMSIQTATRVSNPDVIEVTLNTTGSGLTIGDYVNLIGVRDNATGASIGIDGTYRVTDTFSSTFRFQPIGNTTLPGSLSLVNCGGAVIKRTDARISFVRIFDYIRERVEVLTRGEAAGAIGVNVVNQISSITPISTNTFSLVTSTNLTSGATYTSSTLTTYASSTSSTVYPTQLVIGVSHTAGLVPGQLYLDWGTETSSTAPTTWFTSLAVPIPSNANIQYFTVPVLARYYRLRFVNGATAQTSFRLTTMLTYNGGGVGSQLSFPRNLQFQLSTTALAGNAAFTGSTFDFGDTMNVYQTLTAVAFADQASASNGFKIQISRDGTTWRDTAAVASVTANTLSSITAHISYRYARVVYTNGATLQGSFTLDAHADSE